MLKEKIVQLASDQHAEVVKMRRHLHKNPELSFQEFETAAFVKAELARMGIASEAIATTGVLALIRGEMPSERVIALRADMDALPIRETNEVPYASSRENVMHACGHDVHTSSLLGTAMILQTLKREFAGTVKLIFQPAEEKLPGGAQLLIRQGVLQNPAPEIVLGQHVSPVLESGMIAIRKGKFMASMDELVMTVKGKGGHGAQPHLNIDPVMISAHILIALQQIVSRMADPTLPTVLSFGKVIANGAFNVIPDEVRIEGTFRTFNETWRDEAHSRMKKIAESIAESMGGKCSFEIIRGYPFLINNENLSDQVGGFAGEYLGREHVQATDLWMAAEDFAYYSQTTPSCFYLLGIANKQKNITSALHTSTFDIDEDALGMSTGLMAYVALRQLGN
jgi:amidohydrolase